jgi:hypothetical protein
MKNNPIIFTYFFLVFFLYGFSGSYQGPLPDFQGDKDNVILDYKTGSFLRPKLDPADRPVYKNPCVAHCDWNNDGLFDLVVGYRVMPPDSLRMVVYINQGSVGDPKFTGESSDSTCFYIKVIHPNEDTLRLFTHRGLHEQHPMWRYLSYIPSVFDFNNDGLFDILVTDECRKISDISGFVTRTGNDSTRRGAWLFMNTGTLGSPEFGVTGYLHEDTLVTRLPAGPYDAIKELFRLDDNGNVIRDNLHFMNYQRMTLLDWDSDGILDINWPSGHKDWNPWTGVAFGDTTADGSWTLRDTSWTVFEDPTGSSRLCFAYGDTFECGYGRTPMMVTTDFNEDGENELLIGDGKGFLSLWTRNPNKPGTIEYLPDIDTLIKKVDSYGYLGLWPSPFAMDYDEDGDTDVLCGYENGSTMGQSIYLFRMTGGVAGSEPIYSSEPSRMQESPAEHGFFGSNINVYPNPFSTSVAIKAMRYELRAMSIDIYDITGKLVWSHVPRRTSHVWSAVNQPNGTYIIRADLGNRITVKKVVLNR